MVLITFITALLLLLAFGTHIAVALGLTAACLLFFFEGMPIIVIAQNVFTSINSYALAAIPFFILTGDIVLAGRLSERLLDFSGIILRRVQGGLAMSVIVASVFFAAVSGSSVASAAALGRSAVELLKNEDYPKRFVAGLVAAGSTMGLMIPPSLTFIIIGSMQGIPIIKLFTAGILPGATEGILTIVVCGYICKRNGWGKSEIINRSPASKIGLGKIFKGSAGILLMPIIILGGIYMGFFTPTEVAAVAAGYVFFLAVVIHRTLPPSKIFSTMQRSLMQAGMIYFIIIGGKLTGFMLISLDITDTITSVVAGSGIHPWMFLLMVNLMLLVLGAVLDGISVIVLTAPILFPIAIALGIDPIHLAVIITANVEVATLTPPVGLNLFVMSGVTGLPVMEVARGIGPFYAVQIAVLLIVTYVPFLSLALIY